MRPAAVLSAIVRVQGLKTANVGLTGLQANLVKTDRAATGTAASAGRAGSMLKTGLGVGAVVAAYGLGKSIKAGATFEKKLDDLSAVTKATTKELALMEKQAIDFGKSTVFSANEAAQAQVELAKGGLSVKQIYGGGLRATLNLAAAGDMELAEAGFIAANAMKLFKLRGEDAAEVADILAIAANTTTADVYDFGMALKQGGSIAQVVGYNLSETVTVLEALANIGIKNSDAGTSMKAAFIQLLTPTAKQSALAEELGIKIMTQNGEMKSAVGISKELRRAVEGKTQAQRGEIFATLAGTDGIRTLLALYGAGPKKLRAMEAKHKQLGYAEEVTAEKTDNLAGDWKKFGNMLEVVGIQIEQKMDPALRTMVQGVTDAGLAILELDLGALGDDISKFIETNEDAQVVAEIWGNIATGVEDVFEAVMPVLEDAAPHWLKYMEGTLEQIHGTFQIITGLMTLDFDRVSEGIDKSFSGLGKKVSAVLSLLGQLFAPVIEWIDRAATNVAGFVTALIPVQVALKALQPFIAIIGFMIAVLGEAVAPAKKIGAIFGDFLVGSFKGAILVISMIIRFIGNMANVIGNAIGLVSNLLRGDWAGAWRNAKELVSSTWKTVTDLLRDGWGIIKAIFKGGMSLVKSIITNGFGAVKDIIGSVASAIGGAFESAWGKITDTFESGLDKVVSVVNAVIDVLNVIPGVDIGHVGDGGGSKGGAGGRSKKGWGSKGYDEAFGKGRPGEYAMGGKVTKPIAIMGEEAPRYHEWVISTNPAYEKANRGYLAAAANDLGVQTFGDGGFFGTGVGPSVTDIAKNTFAGKAISSAADLASKGSDFLLDKLPDANVPEPFAGVGPFVIKKAEEFITGWFDKNEKLGSMTGFAGPPPNFKQLGDNSWIDSHTYRVAEFIASKFGQEISSDYRTAAENAAANGSPTSSHMRGSVGNPGAFDFVPPQRSTMEWVAAHIAGITENEMHDYGSGLHNHIAFFAKGGKLDDWDKLVGGHDKWNNDELATLAHIARIQSPGFWAQKAQGESGSSANAANRKAVGHDPGGTEGLGLWQVTTGFHDDKIAKYGGRTSMFHPYFNALAANEVIGEGGAFYADPTGPKGNVDSKLSEAMRAILSGKPAAMSEGEEKKIEAKQLKQRREAKVQELLNKVKGSKTLPGKRTAYWELINYYGKFGIFDDEEKEQTLQRVRQIASAKNPLNTIPGLSKLSKYLRDNVELTGRDSGNFPSIEKDIEKSREAGQKKGERRRKTAFNKITGKGLREKEQEYIDGLGNQIEEAEEKIGSSESWFGTRGSEGKGDLSDLETEALIGMNQGMLGTMYQKRSANYKYKGHLDNRFAKVQKEIKRAQPRKSKTHWKLKALRENRDAIIAAKQAVVGDISDLQGITGEGGRINDTRLKLAELGIKEPSESESDRYKEISEMQAELALDWKKRYIVSQHQYDVMRGFPSATSMANVPGYALGGEVTPIWVGERGKELLYPRVGSRVVSNRESAQITRDHASGAPLVIEKIEFHEADGRVVMETSEGRFEQKVKDVTRRQAKGPHTPGGGTLGP